MKIAIFAKTNVMIGTMNPVNVKKLYNLFPLLSLIIIQSRVPHSNPKWPQSLVRGSDSRQIGTNQQNAIVIFVVLLWLYISLLGKYTEMHLIQY